MPRLPIRSHAKAAKGAKVSDPDHSHAEPAESCPVSSALCFPAPRSTLHAPTTEDTSFAPQAISSAEDEGEPTQRLHVTRNVCAVSAMAARRRRRTG